MRIFDGVERSLNGTIADRMNVEGESFPIADIHVVANRRCSMLKNAGARDIIVCVTHALFDQAAAEKLRTAGASAIASTDAVRHPTNAIALAPLLADALRSEAPP